MELVLFWSLDACAKSLSASYLQCKAALHGVILKESHVDEVEQKVA